jgi:WhiB family transcriptional regulator, redox-sensing transcriptional regulator
VCLHCPVCKPCREHALRVHEPYGVWGGMTEEERDEHYAREKSAARAAKLAALAAAKNTKPVRKPPTKVPVKLQAKPNGAPTTAPSNGMTMTRPANAVSAGVRAKAKSK